MGSTTNISTRLKSKAVKAKAKNLGVYINLKTDFGFKRVFRIKKVMLKFLNAILNIEGGITDLTYVDTEVLGLSKEDRKAVCDGLSRQKHASVEKFTEKFHRRNF